MKHRSEPDYEMMVEGEPDLKPFKVYRVTADDQLSLDAEYATEPEAMSHKRRGDWRYRIYDGRKQLWPPAP